MCFFKKIESYLIDMLNPYVYTKSKNRCYYDSQSRARRDIISGDGKNNCNNNNNNNKNEYDRLPFDERGFTHSYRLSRVSDIAYRVPITDRKRVLRMLQTISSDQLARYDNMGKSRHLIRAIKIAERNFKRVLSKVGPISFETELKFSGGARCLTTPPLDQITQIYTSSLNTLFKKYDSQMRATTSTTLQPTLCAPPVMQRNVSSTPNSTCLLPLPSSSSQSTCPLPNESLKGDMKRMFNSELVQGCMKEQLQGGKSKTKQVAFPGRVVLQMRATVLPAPFDIALDEVVLPVVLYNVVAPYVGRCCLTFNRYPIIADNSVKVFTRFRRCECHCVHFSSELLNDSNVDMDGDCTLKIYHDGTLPLLEAVVNLHPTFKMYRGLGRVATTFAQPITVRFQMPVYRQLFLRYCYGRPESTELERRFCDTVLWIERTQCRGEVKTTSLLPKVLLFLTEYCGSSTAIAFIEIIRRVCFEDPISRFDACLVREYTADDPTIGAILDSGTKGCRELMHEILTKRPLTDINEKCMKFLRDHQSSSKSISTLSTSLTRLSLSTQNLQINHNFNVVCLDPYGTEIVLGSIIDICDPTFLMSRATSAIFYDSICAVPR